MSSTDYSVSRKAVVSFPAIPCRAQLHSNPGSVVTYLFIVRLLRAAGKIALVYSSKDSSLKQKIK